MEKLRTYREKQLKKEDEKLYNEIIQYGSIFFDGEKDFTILKYLYL